MAAVEARSAVAALGAGQVTEECTISDSTNVHVL